MKSIMWGLFFCFLSLHICAQEAKTPPVCDDLIALAETKDADEIYDICGMNDPQVAWYKWAPIASARSYKKALYYLCQKYPTHDYHSLYCKKAQDAGSVAALYDLALDYKDKGDTKNYIRTLDKVLEVHPMEDVAYTFFNEDKIALKAYNDLAWAYLNGEGVLKDIPKAISLLKVAADLDDKGAAQGLGVAFFMQKDMENTGEVEKYLAKAILLGCEVAQESVGYLGLYRDGQLTKAQVQALLLERGNACFDKPIVEQTEPQLQCNCKETMSWVDRQKGKPYRAVRIEGMQGVIENAQGQRWTLAKNQETPDGYRVEEIRKTAVILRRGSRREVLTTYETPGCVPQCEKLVSQNLQPQMTPIHFVFNEDECRFLENFIETLNNPAQPFTSLYECQFKDWNLWGEKALENNYVKHLYLLENYDKSDYLPAFVDKANYVRALDDERYDTLYVQTLEESTQKNSSDGLSLLKQEEAYCLKTMLYLSARHYNPEQALVWAEAGAQRGFAQSLNILGALYAKGIGTEQDLKKAESLFKDADKVSGIIFKDALENYQSVKAGQTSDLKYGQCDKVMKQEAVLKEQILDLYK